MVFNRPDGSYRVDTFISLSFWGSKKNSPAIHKKDCKLSDRKFACFLKTLIVRQPDVLYWRSPWSPEAGWSNSTGQSPVYYVDGSLLISSERAIALRRHCLRLMSFQDVFDWMNYFFIGPLPYAIVGRPFRALRIRSFQHRIVSTR
jgi:hypothetical protein